MMHAAEPTPIEQLKKAVIDQKTATLPPEEEDPALVNLHEVMVAYEQLVSQIVIGLIQTDHADIPWDQIHADQNEISRLLSSPQAQASRKTDFYRAYAARLDRMITLAGQAAGHNA